MTPATPRGTYPADSQRLDRQASETHPGPMTTRREPELPDGERLLRRVILDELAQPERAALVRRGAVPDEDVRRQVAAILNEVRAGGDRALTEAGRRFGGARPGPVRVSAQELSDAEASLPLDLLAAFRRAIANLTTFHSVQRPEDRELEVEPGVRVARRWAPLLRVGVYVPGGRAAYPSSLLMAVVPARVAGVDEVVVASPAGSDGELSPALLGAAALLDVDELYVMGGAQAIAALAYGTETIAPVDKVVGPGNPWVTAAKLAVYGDCAIDLPAGPSEVMVVAGAGADPRLVAADLLSQAEHGSESPSVLVTWEEELADRVELEVEDLLDGLERGGTLRRGLARGATVVLTTGPDQALAFAEEYAPEHLTLLTPEPAADAERVRSAGSVFLGPWTPESAGDYATGANHVLPTGGLARACSPLGVEDFGSWRQVQQLTPEGLGALRDTVGALAAAEGLTAHRLAVEARFEERRR